MVHRMFGRHAARHILRVRGGRNDALMNFMNPAVNGRLLRGVFAVHQEDQVVRRFDSVESDCQINGEHRKRVVRLGRGREPFR
jgi:hypothetical protein